MIVGVLIGKSTIDWLIDAIASIACNRVVGLALAHFADYVVIAGCMVDLHSDFQCQSIATSINEQFASAYWLVQAYTTIWSLLISFFRGRTPLKPGESLRTLQTSVAARSSPAFECLHLAYALLDLNPVFDVHCVSINSTWISSVTQQQQIHIVFEQRWAPSLTALILATNISTKTMYMLTELYLFSWRHRGHLVVGSPRYF